MKTLYHGTIDKLVPAILKSGLKPVRSNMWNAVTLPGSDARTGYNPKKDDEPGYVYLSPRGERAADYAKSKESYFRSEPGHVFELDGMGGMTMKKDPRAPYFPDAKPVVLEVNVPDELDLEIDPHDTRAYRYKGTIKPDAIKPISLEAAKKITDSPYEPDPFEAFFQLMNRGTK